MTLSAVDLWLYAAAVLVLFLTPGPVWVALIARAVSGGFAAAWPLALGVVVGDAVWPLAAVYGLTWITAAWGGAMEALRWVAVAIFLVMGVQLYRHADRALGEDSRLTRPGAWAGFVAGLAVILGNPKAILFYMGVLPGFFDLRQVTGADIAAIVAVSTAVPLAGNLALAGFLDRARRLVASPGARATMNRGAGVLLMGVGVAIGLT